MNRKRKRKFVLCVRKCSDVFRNIIIQRFVWMIIFKMQMGEWERKGKKRAPIDPDINPSEKKIHLSAELGLAPSAQQIRHELLSAHWPAGSAPR